jgi:hypothetical protein
MTTLAQQPAFILGNRILTVVDLDRALRDLKDLDDALRQNDLRAAGMPTSITKTNRTLEDLARDNQLSLLDTSSRDLLVKQLIIIRRHAPIVHMSFPSEPSRKALDTIAAWLRRNVDHYALVQVGLEPVIGIGCIVRTQNKIIDCSLKHAFRDNKVALKRLLAAPPEDIVDDPEALFA